MVISVMVRDFVGVRKQELITVYVRPFKNDDKFKVDV